jgi:hypothetical protein
LNSYQAPKYTGSITSPRARHQWHTPVILTTQKAEIRKIVVQSQPRKRAYKTLSQKKICHKKELVEWLKV